MSHSHTPSHLPPNNPSNRQNIELSERNKENSQEYPVVPPPPYETLIVIEAGSDPWKFVFTSMHPESSSPPPVLPLLYTGTIAGLAFAVDAARQVWVSSEAKPRLTAAVLETPLVLTRPPMTIALFRIGTTSVEHLAEVYRALGWDTTGLLDRTPADTASIRKRILLDRVMAAGCGGDGKRPMH